MFSSIHAWTRVTLYATHHWLTHCLCHQSPWSICAFCPSICHSCACSCTDNLLAFGLIFSLLLHKKHTFLPSIHPSSHSIYSPNHLTYSTHITVSPEQASMLVHHPSMPVSLGLSYPTNLGFCPHQGPSCPSSPGFYHPTQLLDSDFVLPQQACKSGMLLGLGEGYVDVELW